MELTRMIQGITYFIMLFLWAFIVVINKNINYYNIYKKKRKKWFYAEFIVFSLNFLLTAVFIFLSLFNNVRYLSTQIAIIIIGSTFIVIASFIRVVRHKKLLGVTRKEIIKGSFALLIMCFKKSYKTT